MSPQQQQEFQQQLKQQSYPTSPWTETFHASVAAQSEPSMPKRPFDSDAQAPTHDALSNIYNGGC